MPLHLTKVAFGCRTIEALEKRIGARVRDGEVRIATRMRPKRADELIGGSLFWIVKHRLVAFQRILRFDDRSDGRIDRKMLCRRSSCRSVAISRRIRPRQ